MYRNNAARNMFLLLLIGLLGFTILFGLLVHGQIMYLLSHTKQQLDNKADRVATRIEEKIYQIYEYAEIIALNPLIKDKDSSVIEKLLIDTINISPLYDSLLVIADDGSLVAEAPLGSYRNCELDCKQLTCAQSKALLMPFETIDENLRYCLVIAVPLQGPNSENKFLVCFINPKSFAETMFPKNQDDKISVFANNNHAVDLYIPSRSSKLYLIPLPAKVIGPIMRKKAPPFLQATAPVNNLKSAVAIYRPFESFVDNNARTVYSGIRSCFMLFFPTLILLTFLVMAINYSRCLFKEQAIRDELTGLYNFRYMQTKLKTLLRYKKNRLVSFVIMDVDDFKHYNDTYGHQAGDQMLRNVANVILENIREDDIAIRYGGDEFAILFPDTGGGESFGVAERIRKAIKAQYGYTVSIGVSCFPDNGATARELIQSADGALYRAKRLSKDRVEKA